MSSDDDLRLREGLEDLHRYLADQVAPLLVADSVELLLDFPPDLTAGALHAWAVGQAGVRRGGETLADFLFHAVKKIQLFEEFNLLPTERFAHFLSELADRLLESTPEGERERLAEMLAYLHRAAPGVVPTVTHLHRALGHADGGPTSAAGEPAVPVTAEELRSLRRFSLLLDRLPAMRSGGADEDSLATARQLMVLAAAGATSAGDLDSRMSRLRAAGVAPAVARDVVRSMAQAIPDWVVRRGASIEVVRGESVEAVRRVVKLAGDGARTLERWRDLLRAAAENFNQGAYGRAITLLDLADQMIAEGEVDRNVAEIARGSAHEGFDMARMLQATADSENRPILRRLVEFFPVWSIRELLDELVYQPDSKRRKLYLSLIEVWGEEARKVVFERLGTASAERTRDPNVWWYLRNLVYLLHRLPPSPEVDPKSVLELVAPFSALGQHPSFQRETFNLLASLPSGLGAPLLIQRLHEAERALGASTPPPHSPVETRKILNTLAAALVRSGIPAARRALIEHALHQKATPNDATARLRELGALDLSTDREVVAKLLDAIKSLQPVKMLGFVVSRGEDTLSDVVRALSSTTDPGVRRVLAGLAEKFPDREFGRLAAAGIGEAVAQEASSIPEEGPESDDDFLPAPLPSAATRPRASLAGDLEVFGLPGLLQSLQQSEASGSLTLRDEAGDERASIQLVAGRLGECRCGSLTGEAAFYQVFEEPVPGTFEFARETNVAAGGQVLEMMALLMEAMRRFDEFQRLRALIPDRAVVTPGENRPTAPPGEDDGDLVRRVWTGARGGRPVRELERETLVDAYRVRALLAHWLEEGAVAIDAAGTSNPG